MAKATCGSVPLLSSSLWTSAAMEQPPPPMAKLAPGVGQEPPRRDHGVAEVWHDPTIPVSGRPCPEVTEKPKAPWGGRCSSSWLVPSGKTSTTRPTARSWPGAPMSSTLSERCGPEPPFLGGEGTRVSGDKEGCWRWGDAVPGCTELPQQPRTAFLGTAGMCQAPSYLSAVVWGRR